MNHICTIFLVLSLVCAALIATIAKDPTQMLDLIVGVTLLISVTAYLFLWLFKQPLYDAMISNDGWLVARKGHIPLCARVHVIRKDGSVDWNVRTTDVDWCLMENNPVVKYRISRYCANSGNVKILTKNQLKGLENEGY